MANYSFNYAFNVTGNCNAVVQEISDNVRRMLISVFEIIEQVKCICNLLEFDFEDIEPIFKDDLKSASYFIHESDFAFNSEVNKGIYQETTSTLDNIAHTIKEINYASESKILDLVNILKSFDSANNVSIKETCKFDFPKIMVWNSEVGDGRCETSIPANHFLNFGEIDKIKSETLSKRFEIQKYDIKKQIQWRLTLWRELAEKGKRTLNVINESLKAKKEEVQLGITYETDSFTEQRNLKMINEIFCENERNTRTDKSDETRMSIIYGQRFYRDYLQDEKERIYNRTERGNIITRHLQGICGRERESYIEETLRHNRLWMQIQIGRIIDKVEIKSENGEHLVEQLKLYLEPAIEEVLTKALERESVSELII